MLVRILPRCNFNHEDYKLVFIDSVRNTPITDANTIEIIIIRMPQFFAADRARIIFKGYNGLVESTPGLSRNFCIGEKLVRLTRYLNLPPVLWALTSSARISSRGRAVDRSRFQASKTAAARRAARSSSSSFCTSSYDITTVVRLPYRSITISSPAPARYVSMLTSEDGSPLERIAFPRDEDLPAAVLLWTSDGETVDASRWVLL